MIVTAITVIYTQKISFLQSIPTQRNFSFQKRDCQNFFGVFEFFLHNSLIHKVISKILSPHEKNVFPRFIYYQIYTSGGKK